MDSWWCGVCYITLLGGGGGNYLLGLSMVRGQNSLLAYDLTVYDPVDIKHILPLCRDCITLFHHKKSLYN